MTQPEAIIQAFKSLGGTRNKSEIKSWVSLKYVISGRTLALVWPIWFLFLAEETNHRMFQKIYVFLREFHQEYID